jgi:signal transduction histidine kinase
MPDEPLEGESGDQGSRVPRAPSSVPRREPLPASEDGACGSCEVAREVAADKARLAVWLAHELRTPLNCVLGYAELLCDQLAGPGRSALLADAERVRDLALHQLALLDDVLDLARLEHGSVPLRIEPIDAIRVLGVVAEAALPLVRRGGNRLCLAVEGEGWVLADETRLRQVLLNLVGNAAKFTHNGLVALGATARGGSVSLHVRDTGCGMAPAEAERLFRPFQQANAAVAAAHGGTGLGLAISKELCERMGGSISLETAVGEGTTFTVTLPAAARQRAGAG